MIIVLIYRTLAVDLARAQGFTCRIELTPAPPPVLRSQLPPPWVCFRTVDVHGSFYFRGGEERGVLGLRLEWMMCIASHSAPPGFEGGLSISVRGRRPGIDRTFFFSSHKISGKILGKKSWIEIDRNLGRLCEALGKAKLLWRVTFFPPLHGPQRLVVWGTARGSPRHRQ